MKKIWFLIFILSIILNSISYVESNSFNDIQNHWAKDSIRKMERDGTISGFEDDTFLPDKEISVSEFLKMLVVHIDLKLITEGKRWPDWYINTAINNNLIQAQDFDDYSRGIKRGEAAKIIANYIKLDDVSKSKNSFSDISPENKEIILKLVNLNIFGGYQDGTFKENGVVTRAQACKIINEAYNARKRLVLTRKYAINSLNSNLKNDSGDSSIQNTYEIQNNRLYIYDSGRFANLNGLSLNQEFIDDLMVIKLIKKLVDDESYTEIMYVPDKYTINTLNVCYGLRQTRVDQGIYYFQFRFYENMNYNLKDSTGIDSFSENVFMSIELDKMWDKLSEFDNEYRASNKSLEKLQNAFSSLFGDNTSKELIKYIKEKLSIVKNISNDDDNPKICEVKKIGKYTFNILCTRDEKIQIFVCK